MTFEWKVERGFMAFAVECETGKVLARVMCREPGCYMVSSQLFPEHESFEELNHAYAWCEEKIEAWRVSERERKALQ